MEYKENGKNETKTATTYLKVGDDPYQAIEGGFVENKGRTFMAYNDFGMSGVVAVSRH